MKKKINFFSNSENVLPVSSSLLIIFTTFLIIFVHYVVYENLPQNSTIQSCVVEHSEIHQMRASSEYGVGKYVTCGDTRTLVGETSLFNTEKTEFQCMVTLSGNIRNCVAQ
jgi:hypothetical protein